MAIQAAVRTYQIALPGRALGVRAALTTGIGYDFTPGAQNQNEIVVPSQWAYDPKAIAITMITIDSNTHRILDADIALNNVNRKFKVFDQVNLTSTSDDIQNTLTHELGHALGLAHNPDKVNVVMYPGARTGEISKRQLSSGDLHGLSSLYAALPALEDASSAPSLVPLVGCSTTGMDVSLWMTLLALPLLSRRRQSFGGRFFRRPLLSGLFLISQMSFASQELSGTTLHDAAIVGTFKVVSTRSFQVSRPAQMLMTEMDVKSRSCLKGTCPERLVLLLPGGRIANIEQIVDGVSLPKVGAVIGVSLTTFPSTGIATLKTLKIFNLGRIEDFVAFASGLKSEGIAAELPLPEFPKP